MHLTHCLRHVHFDNGDEEKLIDYYLARVKGRSRFTMEKDEFVRMYKIGLCDFGRFLISVFYTNASPEVFEAKKDKENVCFANRNGLAAISVCKRLSRFLDELGF